MGEQHIWCPFTLSAVLNGMHMKLADVATKTKAVPTIESKTSISDSLAILATTATSAGYANAISDLSALINEMSAQIEVALGARVN